MIQIQFQKQHLEDFTSNILEPLQTELENKIKQTTTKYEKEFLVYIMDNITIESIITASPKGFSAQNTMSLNQICINILKQIRIISSKIVNGINNKNFEKYLQFLTKSELGNILEKKEISFNENSKKDDLKKLIVSKLHEFDTEQKIIFEKRHFKKKIYVLMSQIFVKFYNTQWDEIPNYNRYVFVNALRLTTCPYCNRNYIFIVDKINKKLRPEIDHFFPKSKYPFLAMSYFNLIPSCSICNHVKNNKFSSKMVNPYSLITEETEIKFSINILKSNYAHDIKNRKYNFTSFNIHIESKTPNQNINIFNLSELYIQHKDIISDLLVKSYCYPQAYIKFLRKFQFTENEIYRYIYNNYIDEKDLHKRPLSKLTKDVVGQLRPS